jgi:choline dehydrogenase-like flavoprotein
MKETYHFDAIVIGSGISGGWAAKELCERGLKTIILERGNMVEHIKDYTTANKNPWEIPHANKLGLEDQKKHHVQCRHYSIGEDNKRYYVNDLENPYEEKQRYDWVRADVFGGRSLLWGRISLRWNDVDFNANLKDGHGVDWPIRYKDLAPWYDHVEKFVGINGSREGLDILPDGIFQTPFEMTCVEKDVKARIESKYPGRKIIHSRSANITAPLDGRSACMSRNLCHRGCPFGAYFSTQSSTLPAAAKTGNLTIRTGAVVNRIIYDEKTQKASGVEVIDRETMKTYVYTADIIFLNASTIATTHILLNSTSSRFQQGMGNDYDLVGRHLMDHHKNPHMSAIVEGFEDQYHYGKRPTGIFIPRFKNIHTQEKDFIRGYNYQGSGYRDKGIPSDEIGAALKENSTEAGNWRIAFGYYGETLPYADNRITLNNNLKDIYGRPGLSIDCSFKENEKAIFKDATDTMREMMEGIGLKNIKENKTMSFPGNANHEMGTARMGHDEKTSVLNKWNQLHAVKNVFITDGSCMTSSSCVNPSLTYMALTARAVDYALKKGK